MKYLLIFLVFLNISFAHKINLFITEENGTLDIYSYFASGAPCQNCTLLIKDGENIILKDTLNKEGKYQYKPTLKNIEVIVDASGGHIAKEKVTVENVKHEDIKTHKEKEQNKEYLNILLGLILIFIGFFVLKKIKK